MSTYRLTGITAPFSGTSMGALGGALQAQHFYGTIRLDTPGLAGIIALTMHWNDGLAARSLLVASVSVLTGAAQRFHEGFAHDWNVDMAGPTLDLTFVGVLGSPVASLSYIIDP